MLKYIYFQFLISSVLFGATFENVWKIVEMDPYVTLPQYKVSYFKLFTKERNIILEDANRTLNSDKDILPSFEKLAHPNGICFKGQWKISEDNIYSGYFKKGSVAPIIIRISSAMSNTKTGENRSFGLAGKIFSTKIPTKTANFFLMDNLGGTDQPYFSDTIVTNQPKISFSMSVLNNIFYALKVSKNFAEVDRDPTIRQLYEISFLDEKNKNIALTPKWLKLTLKTATNHNTTDFRQELKILKNGRTIFNIFVANQENNGVKNWRYIGEIELTKSISSLGCDQKLHFHHPKMIKINSFL